LEADPNVRLQILDEVADVDMAIGVRQGAGDEDLLVAHEISFGDWQTQL
jgi:hypothetical protein